MPRQRILIIDDEPEFLETLKASLERGGIYEVMTEGRGTGFFAAARAFRPDLILLDLLMPDMDGATVATELARDDRLRNIPIIFMSAAVSREEVHRLGGRFCSHPLLSKSLSPQELVDQVRSVLEGGEPRAG